MVSDNILEYSFAILVVYHEAVQKFLAYFLEHALVDACASCNPGRRKCPTFAKADYDEILIF